MAIEGSREGITEGRARIAAQRETGASWFQLTPARAQAYIPEVPLVYSDERFHVRESLLRKLFWMNHKSVKFLPNQQRRTLRDNDAASKLVMETKSSAQNG